MDGLLIDTEPMWFAVETRSWPSSARPGSTATTRTLVGSSLPVSSQFIAERAGGVGDRAAGRRAAAARPHARTVAHATVLPGIRELIAELDDAGIPRALVSSSYRVLVDAALEGLAPMTFDAVVVGDEVVATQAAPGAVSAGCLDARPRPG